MDGVDSVAAVGVVAPVEAIGVDFGVGVVALLPTKAPGLSNTAFSNKSTSRCHGIRRDRRDWAGAKEGIWIKPHNPLPNIPRPLASEFLSFSYLFQKGFQKGHELVGSLCHWGTSGLCLCGFGVVGQWDVQ